MIDINLATGISSAAGLLDEDKVLVSDLVKVWEEHRERNLLREEYYLAHVRVKDLGIAMPKRLAKKIDPRVDWAKKAVHALADRSVLNGYTSDDMTTTEELRVVYRDNSLDSLYRKNLICELKHCCGFWTVTENNKKPIISAYPATAASAIWDDALKRIKAGLVVVESKKIPGSQTRTPSWVRVFTSDTVIEITHEQSGWSAEYKEHSMGRPLIEPMAYGATLERPFGTSRISRSVMSITDDAIRQRARMEVAAESSTLPQMWLLGTAKRMVTPDNKYDASMGAINEVTKDEDGDKPEVWQGAQLQMAPLSEYLRNLACQMSAITNVPVSFFGVANDNPSSAEAIAASLEPLVIDAKNLNRDNGAALRNVAYMALAVLHDSDYETERARGLNVNPRFMSPAYPSIVSQSDAIVKQVQAVPKLADSDVILEKLDYTDEEMQRINSDAKRADAQRAISAIINGNSDADSAQSYK